MDRQDEANKRGMARLYRAMLSLETVEECKAFLEDLCTFKEVEEMARRLEVAGLLEQGRNYQEIARQTAVSTATISRVNRALRYGSGGYGIVLARMQKQDDDANADTMRDAQENSHADR
ncbi:MAG TPA: YerC/YecD family TrpR-related protein [Desulfuromonadaceae bacterium]